jgi:hypothetical protein
VLILGCRQHSSTVRRPTRTGSGTACNQTAAPIAVGQRCFCKRQIRAGRCGVQRARAPGGTPLAPHARAAAGVRGRRGRRRPTRGDKGARAPSAGPRRHDVGARGDPLPEGQRVAGLPVALQVRREDDQHAVALQVRGAALERGVPHVDLRPARRGASLSARQARHGDTERSRIQPRQCTCRRQHMPGKA